MRSIIKTVMIPVVLRATIAVPITLYANTPMITTMPTAAQRGASTYFRP